jgi:hypothetical protein
MILTQQIHVPSHIQGPKAEIQHKFRIIIIYNIKHSQYNNRLLAAVIMKVDINSNLTQVEGMQIAATQSSYNHLYDVNNLVKAPFLLKKTLLKLTSMIASVSS